VETDPDPTYYRGIFEGMPTPTKYAYAYEVSTVQNTNDAPTRYTNEEQGHLRGTFTPMNTGSPHLENEVKLHVRGTSAYA
jgi:hypothetical protein